MEPPEIGGGTAMAGRCRFTRFPLLSLSPSQHPSRADWCSAPSWRRDNDALKTMVDMQYVPERSWARFTTLHGYGPNPPYRCRIRPKTGIRQKTPGIRLSTINPLFQLRKIIKKKRRWEPGIGKHHAAQSPLGGTTPGSYRTRSSRRPAPHKAIGGGALRAAALPAGGSSSLHPRSISPPIFNRLVQTAVPIRPSPSCMEVSSTSCCHMAS